MACPCSFGSVSRSEQSMEPWGASCYRKKRMGPGAFKHRGARHLRYRRRISGRHQLDITIEKRVAFALPILRLCLDCWRRNRASSCCSPNLRRDLAVEQGHWLEPVASCSSPRMDRRTSVRIRCVLFDHMIGRSFPRSGEPNAPLPRQVQHRNAAADTVRCQVALCETGLGFPCL